MKKLSYALFRIVASVLVLAGCDDPEPPLPNNPVEVNGVPEVLEVQVYEKIGPLTIGVFGEDFLSSFRILKNGEELQAWNLYLTGQKYFYTNFTYVASPMDLGKEVVFEFEALDTNGDLAKSEMRLTVFDLPNTIKVSSDISSDQTWESGNVYILPKQISVLPGATLTLQKGVIVKAEAKEGDRAPFLVVERGAKIMANGTQEEPIIFTSILDEIQPGENSSPFVPQSGGPMGNWEWGGFVILGKAKGSFAGDVSEVSLKARSGVDYGLVYGGDDNQDNSGVLNYVSIRNVGSLTLAGVGSGTQINKVEVYQGGLDGIRIFGGTVNLENIMVSSSTTGLNIEQGWNGTFENFYFFQCQTSIEVFGPKGSYYGGNHHITKGSIDLPFGDGILNFEENSNTDLSKIYFQFVGTRSNATFPGEGIYYWINLVPSSYMPQVSELEVYSSGPINSDLFLEWSDKVKILPAPGSSSSVGVDIEPFEKWSIIRENLYGEY